MVTVQTDFFFFFFFFFGGGGLNYGYVVHTGHPHGIAFVHNNGIQNTFQYNKYISAHNMNSNILKRIIDIHVINNTT